MKTITLTEEQEWFLRKAIEAKAAVLSFHALDDKAFECYGITRCAADMAIVGLGRQLEERADGRESYRATKSEISAIVEAAENLEAIIGTGDEDSADRQWEQIVISIDRFLQFNRMARKTKKKK